MPLDWPTLTDVGQTYTGIATILSGAALLGVVVSIRQQNRQFEQVRAQSIREIQFGLLQMAMEDNDLASVIAPIGWPGRSDHQTYRRSVYRTQWMRYVEYAYTTGDIGDAAARDIVLNEIFARQEGREWWSRARPYAVNHASQVSKQYRGL